jgi:5-methylcytosine-specific restriction endonuclease McrA
MHKPQTKPTHNSAYGTQPRDLRNDSSGTRRLRPEPWSFVRERIWQRDKGICQICGVDLRGCHRTWGWRCGHIIDRVAGGNDEDHNLVVMCEPCDQLKPVHWNVDEYEEWKLGRTK